MLPSSRSEFVSAFMNENGAFYNIIELVLEPLCFWTYTGAFKRSVQTKLPKQYDQPFLQQQQRTRWSVQVFTGLLRWNPEKLSLSGLITWTHARILPIHIIYIHWSGSTANVCPCPKDMRVLNVAHDLMFPLKHIQTHGDKYSQRMMSPACFPCINCQSANVDRPATPIDVWALIEFN